LFSIVELQNTFYDLPDISWFEALRKEAPENFIFSIKAWQVITHPSKSPTWKRIKQTLYGNIDNYGWLKPTKENFNAWNRIIEAARTLNAKFIVIQTPPSLPYTSESVKWIREFFSQIKPITPKGIHVGWEPRGEWIKEKALHDLAKILEEYDIIHIVDLFKRKPLYKGGLLYTRLHGLDGEINYKYKYKDEDLEKLAKMIIDLGYRENYVLFNNIYMLKDGQRFKEIAKMNGLETY